MNLITLQRPATASPIADAAPAPTYYAATDAFRVLRAWRAWAAQCRDDAATGFALVRDADGSLLLASDGLDGTQLDALGRFSHRRPRPLPARVSAGSAQRADAATAETPLRALDDWTLESFLRAGAELHPSRVVSLRHRAGRFSLVTPAGGDTTALHRALAPWINR